MGGILFSGTTIFLSVAFNIARGHYQELLTVGALLSCSALGMVDVIRVDNNDSTSGTSRLEVGKYITESIYLSYVHQFGAPTGIHPVNSNEAQLQYRFKRHYQLETKFGDAGVGAVNFYWSLRY